MASQKEMFPDEGICGDVFGVSLVYSGLWLLHFAGSYGQFLAAPAFWFSGSGAAGLRFDASAHQHRQPGETGRTARIP